MLTFKPSINENSKRIAETSGTRTLDFTTREKMFLEQKKATIAIKADQLLQQQESQLTFQPQLSTQQKTAVSSCKATSAKVSNFWERNLAFMNAKKDNVKKLD